MVAVFDAATEFSESDCTGDARLGPFVLIPARRLLQRLSESSVQELDASTDQPKHRESVPTVARVAEDSPCLCLTRAGGHLAPTVARDTGNSPALQRRRRSNVQFTANIPITVALIGSCPITRDFVARPPKRHVHTESHWKRTGMVPCPVRTPVSVNARSDRSCSDGARRR